MSSRPARIPIVSTIRSALALQWVTFRRGLGRKYYRESFQEFWFWQSCALIHVIMADILLTSGIFARLGPALEREALSQNASAVDIAVILMCTLFALFTYSIYFSRFRQRVDLFLQVHAFSLCYDRCVHLDRLQMARMRLAQVIPLHADRFRYSFSGPTLVVTVGEREQADGPSSLASESLVQAGASGQVTLVGEAGPASPGEQQEAEDDSRSLEEKLVLCISLGQGISLFLRERQEPSSGQSRKGKRVMLPLGHEAYQALFAYFAIRGARTWVAQSMLLEQVYGYASAQQERQQAFNTHISRIRRSVRASIQEHFPAWASQVQTFKVFEQEKRGKSESFWRLTPACSVIGIESLRQAYRQIREAKGHSRAAHAHELSEEKLCELARYLIKRYSDNYLDWCIDEEEYVGGYLVEKLHERQFRSWVPGFFRACREQYIAILDYAAQCESRLWQQTQQRQYLDRAIRWYKECAYAATCPPADQKQGERALRAGMRLFQANNDPDAEQSFYDTYSRRVKHLSTDWTPERETRELLAELGVTVEE